MSVVLAITLFNMLISIFFGSINDVQKDELFFQAKLRINLFLELDPKILSALKGKVIPKYYRIKGSASTVDKAYIPWNFTASKFSIILEDFKVEETKESQKDYKIKDIHYRIKKWSAKLNQF